VKGEDPTGWHETSTAQSPSFRPKGSPLDYFAGVNMTDLGGLALARKRCCAGTPKSAALSYIETSRTRDMHAAAQVLSSDEASATRAHNWTR
jgi:hypothetical protein